MLPERDIWMSLNVWSKREPMSMPKVSDALTTKCNRLMFAIQTIMNRRFSGMLLRRVILVLLNF